MGCIPRFPIMAETMKCYDGDGPYNTINGHMNYLESPRICTKVLLRHGLRQDGSRQKVADMEVLPVEYLCPLDYAMGRMKITENTYSIHHYDGSWQGKNAKYYKGLMQFLNRTFGEKRGRKIFSGLMQAKDVFKKFTGR